MLVERLAHVGTAAARPAAAVMTGGLSAVPKYLTQEWLDEYRRLAGDQPERPGATARIQYVIEGTHEIHYYVEFEDGRVVSSRLGDHPSPDVTLSMSYEDSTGIEKGELDPNQAFNQGRIGFDGEMRKLMALLPILWPSPARRLSSAAGRYRAVREQLRAITEF
jgi:putative sterol carrier protein